MDKIKVIIADDNKELNEFIKKYLQKYDEIEVLGCAFTDEEEIEMIEKMKPDIIITDLMRNHKLTGLEIIRQHKSKSDSPKFLVISAEGEEFIRREKILIDGYIRKPFWDYNIIVKELLRINELYKEEKIISNVDKVQEKTNNSSYEKFGDFLKNIFENFNNKVAYKR